MKFDDRIRVLNQVAERLSQALKTCKETEELGIHAAKRVVAGMINETQTMKELME